MTRTHQAYLLPKNRHDRIQTLRANQIDSSIRGFYTGWTGARKSEIISLKWEYLDRQRLLALLPDSKTGAKPIFLSKGVMKILEALPRLENSPWIFPSLRSDGHIIGLQKIWNDIRRKAGIPDVRIHDLRHSFASVGATNGESLYIVGKALGHSNPNTTQRYAHLADSPVHDAVNAISDAIEAQLIPSDETVAQSELDK